MTAVALWVRDLERSASFYRDVVGVPLEFSEPHEPENVEHYEVMWGDWGEKGPTEPSLLESVWCESRLPSPGVVRHSRRILTGTWGR